MASLGSFGAAVRELDPDAQRDTFDFFGETFTVHGVIPPIAMLQLGAAMAGKASEIDGNAAMWEVFRSALTKPVEGRRGDDSQFDRFYALAADRTCHTNELIKLAFALIGAQADLPTEQLPTSPDGQLPTSDNSRSSASDAPGSATPSSDGPASAG